MADSKLEIKVGAISFAGEGPGDWLSKQLDKVLTKLPELLATAPPEESDSEGQGAAENSAGKSRQPKKLGTLAAFLKDSKVSGSQPRKFLAAAVWVQDTGNKNRISTTDVSAALSSHNQGKLANASDCLIKNTAKGFCVREGRQFYVTEEGREELK
jgi:hypothetical protein